MTRLVTGIGAFAAMKLQFIAFDAEVFGDRRLFWLGTNSAVVVAMYESSPGEKRLRTKPGLLKLNTEVVLLRSTARKA